MHSLIISLLIAFALSESIERRNLFCTAVTKLVTVAKQQSAATAFCSSYLHITPQTVSGQTTTTTTTTTAPTNTVTVTAATCGSPANKLKREAAAVVAKNPVPKPTCFKAYPSGALLSSACNCLSIKPSTVTLTNRPTTTRTTIFTPAPFTRTALPPPSCSTIVSQNTWSEYYAGCGYKRPNGFLLQGEQQTNNPVCSEINDCINAIELYDPDYTAFEVVAPADGSSYDCYIFYGTGSGAGEFNQPINPGDAVYGYSR